MRKEFQEYWFPMIERIEDENVSYLSDNYVRFRDKTHKTLLRFINGEPIKIKCSIYKSEEYKETILKLFKNLFLRFLKEYHIPINEIDKFRLESNNIDNFIRYGFCHIEYMKMIELYIYKL